MISQYKLLSHLNIHNYLKTNYPHSAQSLWENRLAGHNNPCLLRNTNIHYRIHKTSHMSYAHVILHRMLFLYFYNAGRGCFSPAPTHTTWLTSYCSLWLFILYICICPPYLKVFSSILKLRQPMTWWQGIYYIHQVILSVEKIKHDTWNSPTVKVTED